MKPERQEELMTRWLDDALTEKERAEFAPLLEEHPEWEAEREEFGRLRASLQGALPAEQEPPYPDFFNAHLERLIRERRDAVVQEPSRAPGWWAALRWWLAPAAAGAMLLAFFAGMQISQPGGDGPPMSSASIVPAVYSPVDSVVTAMEDKALGGMVIVLDGLEIPDDVELFQTAGFQPDGRPMLITTGDGTF